MRLLSFISPDSPPLDLYLLTNDFLNPKRFGNNCSSWRDYCPSPTVNSVESPGPECILVFGAHTLAQTGLAAPVAVPLERAPLQPHSGCRRGRGLGIGSWRRITAAAAPPRFSLRAPTSPAPPARAQPHRSSPRRPGVCSEGKNFSCLGGCEQAQVSTRKTRFSPEAWRVPGRTGGNGNPHSLRNFLARCPGSLREQQTGC